MPSAKPLNGAIVSLAALSLFGLLSCEATQPAPICRAQQSAYAARYLEPQVVSGTCTGKMLSGEILHLQYYRGQDPEEATSIAIEPQSVADAIKVAMNPPNAGTEYSLGKYTTFHPDANGICRVEGMTVNAKITAGSASIGYIWTNIEMLVTPTTNAIHFGAQLERTDGDCVVRYKVVAMNPAKGCGDGKDAMGEDDPMTGNPVQAACNSMPGSGLSPRFSYECLKLGAGGAGPPMCVAKKTFPSWNE
jgi:hypothetical protein